MLSQLFLLLLPLMCSSSVALFRRRICVCVCVRNAICCNKTSKKKTFRHKTFNIMKLLRHLRTWAPDHTTFLESQPTALWIAANMDVIWWLGPLWACILSFGVLLLESFDSSNYLNSWTSPQCPTWALNRTVYFFLSLLPLVLALWNADIR